MGEGVDLETEPLWRRLTRRLSGLKAELSSVVEIQMCERRVGVGPTVMM